MEQRLTVRHAPEGVLLIQLTHPDTMNALNLQTKLELLDHLRAAQIDDRVRVVVLTGSGRAFCAGDDMKGGYFPGQVAGPAGATPVGSPSPMRTSSLLRTVSGELCRAIRSLDKICVAAVNGFAVQSGLSLALACDLKIAGRAAMLGSGTLRYGLLPDEGGHSLLVEHVGTAATMDLLLRKRMLTAEQALGMGLLNEVVDDDELLDTVLGVAEELAAGPQVAMRLLKRAVYNARGDTLERAIDDISVRAAISDHHDDVRAGFDAFRHKTTPRFNAWLEPEV